MAAVMDADMVDTDADMVDTDEDTVDTDEAMVDTDAVTVDTDVEDTMDKAILLPGILRFFFSCRKKISCNLCNVNTIKTFYVNLKT